MFGGINTDDLNYWTSQDKLEEICQRQLDHVIDEQLNSLSLPFSWSISDPSLFSSADEYQKLLETCRDAGTVIHALTGKFRFMSDCLCNPKKKVLFTIYC